MPDQRNDGVPRSAWEAALLEREAARKGILPAEYTRRVILHRHRSIAGGAHTSGRFRAET
jgi:hypothetical protein